MSIKYELPKLAYALDVRPETADGFDRMTRNKTNCIFNVGSGTVHLRTDHGPAL